MSDRYKSKKKDNKNIKGLFSVVCLSIIALGMIVYFGANSRETQNNAVNENQTLQVTTDVQRAVTLQETTAPANDDPEIQEETTEDKESSDEPATMEQGEANTPYKSFYEYPVSEAVLKGYSEELVFDETMGDYRAHAGVDFKGSEGDDVFAINAGIVIRVYTDNLYGQVVEIDHGGTLTAKYCGLESINVSEGSSVDIGSKIGTLGSVPIEGSQETHLHFETRLDGKLVNPLDVMGKTE